MNWPIVSLGEICNFEYGKSLPASTRKEGDVAVFGSNGSVGSHAVPLTSGQTVIIGRKGSIGEVNFSETSCWPIDTTYFVDENSTNQDIRWLYYALQHSSLQHLNRATGVPGLNRNDAYEVKLLLPPLSEQKRIAAILDQADALRRLRRRALDRLNALGQAIFQEMFGDPSLRSTMSLMDVLVSAGNGMTVEQDDSGEGIPVTRIETIWNGEIDESRVKWARPDPKRADKFLMRPGDILFSHINSPEHIGKTALYEGNPEKMLHGINLLRLQPDLSMTDPQWLVHFLKTPQVRNFFRMRCKKAVNQASLNQQNLGELRFHLPALSLQRKFSSRVREVKRTTTALQTAYSSSSSLFTSLQHRAFRGEL